MVCLLLLSLIETQFLLVPFGRNFSVCKALLSRWAPVTTHRWMGKPKLSINVLRTTWGVSLKIALNSELPGYPGPNTGIILVGMPLFRWLLLRRSIGHPLPVYLPIFQVLHELRQWMRCSALVHRSWLSSSRICNWHSATGLAAYEEVQGFKVQWKNIWSGSVGLPLVATL
jgi:hypothetical protein